MTEYSHTDVFSPAFLTSDDFIRSNEIIRTNYEKFLQNVSLSNFLTTLRNVRIAANYGTLLFTEFSTKWSFLDFLDNVHHTGLG